ncbi:MAG: bifunctional pyr operon transcriptional regulator/uracil phosphoribosyltransferase PyrR [bacterium]
MKSDTQSEKLMDKAQITEVIQRIAKEIIEDIKPIEEGIMVGIRSRGGDLAKRIAKEIKKITGFDIPIGYIDTTLYRDDIASSGPKPVLQKTEIPFSITNRRIILVDDVLYTGRTIRAALDALIDFGRPKCIRLAVLIDRGHRELPIYADYVGKKLDLPISKSVKVTLVEENGHKDQAIILPFPETVSW